MLFLSVYHLFANYSCSLFLSRHYSLFCSQPFCKHYRCLLAVYSEDLQTATSQKADWINTNCCLFVLPYYSVKFSVERTFLKWKPRVPNFSWILSRVSTHILVYSSCVLLLLVYLEDVRWICKCGFAYC